VLSDIILKGLEELKTRFSAKPEQTVNFWTGKKEPRVCGWFGCGKEVQEGKVRWCKYCGEVFCGQHRDHKRFSRTFLLVRVTSRKSSLPAFATCTGRRATSRVSCADSTTSKPSCTCVGARIYYEKGVCHFSPYEESVREHVLDDVSMMDADTGRMLTDGTTSITNTPALTNTPVPALTNTPYPPSPTRSHPAAPTRPHPATHPHPTTRRSSVRSAQTATHRTSS